MTRLISLGRGNQVFAVAPQAGGGVVVAGRSAGGKVLVERFSRAGKRTGRFIGPAGFAKAMAPGGHGTVVVAGTSGGSMFVERLTAGLRPDQSFGAGGIRRAFGAGAVANGVAVARDGSVVIAGSVGPPVTQVGAAKFSRAGRLQWSKTLDYGRFSLANSVAVQRDGKIVLVGSQTPLQGTNGLLIRLNGNGSVDSGFGGRGAFTYHYPGGAFTQLNAVTVQGNGKIVAGGVAYALAANALFLRLNGNGSFDGGFGRGGVVAPPSSANVNVPGDPIGAYGLTIASGGRIIGAGDFENTGSAVDASLWSLTSRGALDARFGSRGTVRQPRGADENCGVVAASDGSLVTAGNTVTTFPDLAPCTVNPASSGFIARYAGFGGKRGKAPKRRHH